MINKRLYRAKFKALLLHSLFTSVLLFIATILIFFVWYPNQFSAMAGGKNIFSILLCVELVLGPIISFVIFNPEKPKRELIQDYSIVIAFQVIAFSYGVYTAFDARPLYMVFAKDRFELVGIGDILADQHDNNKGRLIRVATKTVGPDFVSIKMPESDQVRGDILYSAMLGGPDIHQMPKYYAEYKSDEVVAVSKPIDTLAKKLLENGSKKDFEGLKKYSEGFSWIPVKTKHEFWTAVIDDASGLPVDYIAFDPY